jgi:hypothetical protein
MRLEKASHKAIKYACLNFHYAKSIPVNVFGYSVFNSKNEWCGVILYGTGANNNIAHQYSLKQGNVIELVRMALNGKQESTSKALSISMKLIKKDIPLVKLLVSYADKDQNHIGIIYQATNWYYTNTSLKDKADASFLINGKRIHGKTISDRCKRFGLSKTFDNICKVYKTADVHPYITKGKIKYIYPLDKNLVSLCKQLSKPYPKAHEVNVDKRSDSIGEIGGSSPTRALNIREETGTI